MSRGAHENHTTPSVQELSHAQVLIPSYNTHYENGVITDGCTLIEVISDRLRNYKADVSKTTIIITALMCNIKKGTCIVSEEAWE